MSTKPDPKTPSLTEIAFILDRSGSMQPLVEAAIAGFNQFLRDQQEGDAETEGFARLTLVQFDDQYEVLINNLPVSEVVSLDATTYVPRGCTALLDAIGTTIDRFKKRIKNTENAHRPDKVIFAIFTDGLENASMRYGWMDIAKKIRKRREKDGWEFLFLAANHNAIATAAQMNIHANDSATAEYSGKGMRSSSRAFSRKIRAMRSGQPYIPDLHAPMEQIMREEEGRDSEN